MSALQKALENGQFGVTAEMAPPKGFDFTEQMEAAEVLRGKVHSINVTDMQSACLKASSIGLCAKLKLAGLEPTERIAAVVLDEGIVIHGGLVIAWPEIVEVRIGRSPRVHGRGIADAAARSLHASQGVSDMITTLMLAFREWEPIDRRATTKAMRRPLMRPVLGLEASATIDLSDLPEWQVQEVLAAIVQQAQRHGIPVESF